MPGSTTLSGDPGATSVAAICRGAHAIWDEIRTQPEAALVTAADGGPTPHYLAVLVFLAGRSLATDRLGCVDDAAIEGARSHARLLSRLGAGARTADGGCFLIG